MENKKIWIILTVVALAFLFVGAVSAAENETNTNENTIVDSYYDDYDNYDDYYDYDNYDEYDEYEEYDYYDEYDEFYEDWSAAEHAWVDAKSTTFQEGQSNNYVVYPSTGSYAIKNSKVTIYLSGNTYTGKYFYKTYKKWSNNNGEAWFSFKNLPAGTRILGIKDLDWLVYKADARFDRYGINIHAQDWMSHTYALDDIVWYIIKWKKISTSTLQSIFMDAMLQTEKSYYLLEKRRKNFTKTIQ